MNTNSELLLNSLSEAVLMLDRDGYIQYANAATTAVTGYSFDELRNQSLSFLYEISDEGIQAEYELSMAAKHGKFLSEGWRKKKDASHYWGEMNITLAYDQENEIAGFSIVLRDTTEKKNDEIQLRWNEERYRLMVEVVKDYSIFMLDPDGNIVTWNEGGKRTQGYMPNEVIGKHFSIFYIAEDLKNEKPRKELEIAKATGKYEEEGWRVRKNGSVYWSSVVITALYNEQNNLIGFSKVTRDLSERRQYEDHLRQGEERFRSLVEQVTDYGIFMMDEKGKIVSWNEGAKRIKGYTADEIIGKYFSIFYPEEDIIKGKPAHELKVARKEGKYEEEGWRLRKDGSRFWANIVITAVYNTDGVLIGFSKVTRDLTERKAAERALRESYDRYRMLATELKVTNNELSYANQELEQFTSIVSHDLQEPIRTIKSFLQLIDIKLSDQQNEELKKYIQKSIGAANKMKELIQNLLHYSQLSKGELMDEDVTVQELINQALQNVKTSIDIKNADITVETDVEKVHGDPIQLVQLIQNLLSNALKFTNGLQPKIKIKCTEENGLIKFSVSDNGIGIAEPDQQKVFEIFRRLNNKKDYPGTGIGLAICKKIVDRHNGRIWPESEPGKGTTFHFTLNEETQEEQTTI